MARTDIPVTANLHRGRYLENGTLLVDFTQRGTLSKPTADASDAVALVLAGERTGTVVRMAMDAGVQAVCVVLPANDAKAAQAQARLPKDPRVHTIRFSHEEAETARRGARNYELFGVPARLLFAGRALLRDTAGATGTSGAVRNLFILDGNQPKIRPRHLRELCGRMDAFPGTDVVTSWIIWFRRMPLLVSGAFLDTLEERIDALRMQEPGRGLIQHLRVQEVVFGEEPLRAPAGELPGARFLDECGISAIEAVRLAKASRAYEAECAKAQAGAAGAAPKANGNAAGAPDGAASKASATAGGGATGTAGAADAAEPKDPLAELSAAGIALVNCAKAALDSLNARSAGSDAPDARPAASDLSSDGASGGGAPAPTSATCSSAAGDFAAEVARASAWGARNKRDFPLLADARQRNLVYLDSAATAQRCFTALSAEQNFAWHENANVYRGAYALSAGATETLNDARASMEGFIGAERRTTVYTASTTDGLNLVAQAWGLRNIRRGDLIVTTIAEHHSNMMPWELLARERRARIAYLPLDERGGIDRAAFRAALEQGPKLVCLAQASNVLGMPNPVEELAREASAVGARVCIDGAQGFPHAPVDIAAFEDAGIDFYAFSAHKAYGPTGIGGLWISSRAFDEMEPLSSGGGAISHVSPDSHYWRGGTIRFEPGTPDVAGACGFAGACAYLSTLGMDRVAWHADVLSRYLLGGLAALGRVSVWGDHTLGTEEAGGGASATGAANPADAVPGASTANGADTFGTRVPESGTVAFSVAGIAPGTLGKICAKLGIAVRSGGHCAFPLSATLGILGSTRISLGVYNTAEDVEAVLTALHFASRIASRTALL